MMKGGFFHEAISAWTKFVSLAKLPDFVLYSVADSYAAVSPGKGTVHGELYQIKNNAILDVLDTVRCPDKRKVFPVVEKKFSEFWGMVSSEGKGIVKTKFPSEAWVFHRPKFTIDSSVCNKISSGIWKLK